MAKTKKLKEKVTKRNFDMVIPKIDGIDNESVLFMDGNIYNLINCLNKLPNIWAYVDKIIDESDINFTVRIKVEITEQVA